jgi:DNA-binding CsgD family transcriptional regulator
VLSTEQPPAAGSLCLLAAHARVLVVELLSDRDVRGLLDFLHDACEVDGPEVFTEPVVEAFRRLIPADGGAAGNTFSGVNSEVQPETRTVLSFSDIDCEWCAEVPVPWTEELDEVCREFVERQEPIPPVPTFMNRVVRRSDVVGRAEWQRRELWHFVDRPRGVEDALCLWLDVPGEAVVRRIMFATGLRNGFGDRDVRVLELLAPHLIRLYLRAARRRETSPGLELLTPREREVIALVAAGKTNREAARYLWISPHTVRTHLENIFEKLEVTSRAAAVARLYTESPPA